ncbi:SRPBCC family protein [Halosimplex sp. J119]
MPVYERETVVDASFDDVWEFHSTAAGLEALTPNWMRLRVESTVGPDGEPDPDVLDAGSKIEATIAPFGIAPRQRWTSHIVAREERDGQARFRDEMVHGPFPTWVHTHSFEGLGDRTRVRDHVEYELPVVGGLLGPLGWIGFEPMFRYRHRKTKELLEE